ncbi:MAG: ribonuclease PH [Sulfuricaulis sp.]|nr:ribonuclease PH [Sulfuricaulis sp.]
MANVVARRMTDAGAAIDGRPRVLYSEPMIRSDGRRPAQLRPVQITPGYLAHAEGSAFIEMGGTAVLCAVTVEDRVPRFAMGTGSGWITAEYGMLPRSTLTRTPRENSARSGRTAEIQRLIGRSLRSIARLDLVPDRTFMVDCDVIRADGGTRTAAITGGCVALVDAINHVRKRGLIADNPMRHLVASVSTGIFGGAAVLDLDYAEDSNAGTDMNFVMDEAGGFIEIQGTAESQTFSLEEMLAMTKLAQQGIKELIAQQKQALGIKI